MTSLNEELGVRKFQEELTRRWQATQPEVWHMDIESHGYITGFRVNNSRWTTGFLNLEFTDIKMMDNRIIDVDLSDAEARVLAWLDGKKDFNWPFDNQRYRKD